MVKTPLLARGALIVGAMIVGSVLIVAALWSGDGGLFLAMLFFVPPLLGIYAGRQAARDGVLLVVAAVALVGFAFAGWFALGPDARAEGGAALIVLWVIPAEFVCLAFTDAVLRVIDRRRRATSLPKP